MEDIKERLEYLEIENLSHLLLQKRSKKAPFNDKNWRESYYFNVTDEKNKLSLITTIGILPNKRRCTGFVIIIHKGKIVYSKLLFSRDIKLHETDNFNLKRLSYQVEGIDWHLDYGSKKCSFDMVFRPINEFYSYINESDERGFGNFARLFSQHIEQAGTFQGFVILDGRQMRFGPSAGHRDHSWGIRDWSSIDSYWLFCCNFGKDRAFNLWNATLSGKPIHAGYIYDQKVNQKITSCSVKGYFKSDKREPKGAEISFTDKTGDKHNVKCSVICSVPIPMPKCIIYETIARMEYEDKVGFGLLERHIHDTNLLHKVKALMNLRNRSRGRKL